MPRQYVALKLLRTILQLWNVDLELEDGLSFDDAEWASTEFLGCLSDEDVVIVMMDVLKELQVWASGQTE